VNGVDVYLDKDEVIKHVYHSTDGMCVGGAHEGAVNLDLKKNGFNSNNGACVTKPSDVSMIDYDIYNDISRESNDFSDAKCDKKHIFSGAIAKFKNERGEFRNKFANMIKTFNELNESEIEMLNGTQESIENLKENINEYNELHKRATTNTGKKTIIDAQSEDSKILLNQSQHTMAFMGIGALGATMIMFNYMKNS
jgi:hypothetical protein